MKILIIGSGGREHAIAWRLAQEGHQIYGAPGNPGIAELGQILATTDYLAAADSINPDLTVVGPEVPLVAGVVDQFRAAKRNIVGPAQDAAQLEGSKIHSKQFMQRLGIPTARFVRVESVDAGIAALADFSTPVVIKADGLAAGKGVIIAQDRAEAEAAVRSLGPRLVIEEFLQGEEVSFIALCDGKNIVPLEATQDHKAVGDGDTGPNTGGMGAYCDGRILSAADAQHVLDTVIRPVVDATRFTGFLYAGLMMTARRPESARIQRSFGRSGNAAVDASSGLPVWRNPAWPPRPETWRRLAALEAATLGMRGAGGGRLSGAGPNRRSHHWNRELRTHKCSRPEPSKVRRGSKLREAACWV